MIIVGKEAKKNLRDEPASDSKKRQDSQKPSLDNIQEVKKVATVIEKDPWGDQFIW